MSWQCAGCGGTHDDEVEDCPVRVARAPKSTKGLESIPAGPDDDELALPDDLIGARIGGYEIRRKIGEGGMGAVYLGVHPALGKRVAVKVILSEGASGEAVRRFFDEARAAAALDSPRIVEVIDFAQLADGRSYMVMEHLEGESLWHLTQRRPLTHAEVVGVAAQTLEGLALAHARGVIHRDIKPGNLFVTREGMKILDFGLAKRTGEQGARGATRSGVVLGTPEYMSPEQGSGGSMPVDGRADLYSLGVVVYELLAGRLPFEAAHWVDMLVKHQKEPPPPLGDEVPPALAAAVLRALAKEPAARFADADAMRAALVDGIAVPPALPVPEIVEPAPEQVRVSAPQVTTPERAVRRDGAPPADKAVDAASVEEKATSPARKVPAPIAARASGRRRAVAVAIAVGVTALLGVVAVIASGGGRAPASTAAQHALLVAPDAAPPIAHASPVSDAAPTPPIVLPALVLAPPPDAGVTAAPTTRKPAHPTPAVPVPKKSPTLSAHDGCADECYEGYYDTCYPDAKTIMTCGPHFDADPCNEYGPGRVCPVACWNGACVQCLVDADCGPSASCDIDKRTCTPKAAPTSTKVTIDFDGGKATQRVTTCQYCNGTIDPSANTAALYFQPSSANTNWYIQLSPNGKGGWNVRIDFDDEDDGVPARFRGRYKRKSGGVTLTHADVRAGGTVDGTIDVTFEGGSDTTPVPATMKGTFHVAFPK